MSKAFTREDDEVPDEPVRRRGVPVPEPNFVTAAGLVALRAELERGGLSDERARELADHLATAVTVDPDRDAVGFGATVTVEDQGGRRTRYRLVGAIEAAPKEGAISWQSPIARALLDARVGDIVALPKGEFEVIAIEY